MTVAAELGFPGLALLVWLTAGGRAAADGGLDHAEEREQVMSLTDQFVKRLGAYSPDMLDDSGQMPDYREQVREVITPKFAADFDKEVATVEQLVAQGGITRTADVFATAVSSVDDDSARVLGRLGPRRRHRDAVGRCVAAGPAAQVHGLRALP